jgi:uncharacterized protein YlbG (UPF0298 family)
MYEIIFFFSRVKNFFYFFEDLTFVKNVTLGYLKSIAANFHSNLHCI